MAKEYISLYHAENTGDCSLNNNAEFVLHAIHKLSVIDCLLVAAGHQSKEKLFACGVPVLDDLFQVVAYILSLVNETKKVDSHA